MNKFNEIKEHLTKIKDNKTMIETILLMIVPET